ncbi:MAG: peptidase M20, partial [Lysobacter sp.]
MKLLAASLLSISIALSLRPAAAAELPTFDPQRLSDMVKTLSSDEFEGRGPATAGETKTIAYLAEHMQAAGLKPGGDLGKDGQRLWTQAVPLLRAEIAGVPQLSVMVKGKAQTLTQGSDVAI